MNALGKKQTYRNSTGRRWTRGGLSLFSLVIVLSLLLGMPVQQAFSAAPVTRAQEGTVLPEAPNAITAAFNYTNATSGQIPDGASGNTGCGYWPATRYFLVNDNFTVNDLNVEFTATHGDRGQIKVTLTAPDGTSRVLIANSADGDNNYNITLDGDSGGAIDDNSADGTAPPTERTVQQTLLNDFDGKNAHGHWTMTICDSTITGSVTQPFTQARLVFDGIAYTPAPYQHQQGPAVVETYFVPWPEDQVWTAMGTIFTSSCSSYSSFVNYDAIPRQPMVGYTSITIVDAGTVVTYDQWEDAYDPTITFPSQSTTQVWGDGNLLNGVAPGDADDLLIAGQVLTLNDVMLSTTLGTIVDYDARDKITASQPIAVSRSVWSDGSQTLFAAADEVYPTDRWGTEYRAPVGDNASLNSMFEYSGASIIAATNGTVVEIDLAGDGTYETTVNLNQGGTYQIDDNTNGLDRGGRIRSNAGHPIQVNQITADVCAGYESRTFPLWPLADWSSSYFSPVGTILDSSGAGSDDAPTTVSLYNPGTSAINVCYDFATGSTNSVSVAANGGTNVTMNDLTGAHFYACTPGGTTTNDVEDQFASQSYGNNNGSVNWTGNWTEENDDGSASTGTIYINATSDHLRFRENSVANDAIRRTANLSGYTSATLSFDINGTNIDTTDDISVEISNNGGSTWTELERFNGDPGAVTRSYDVSSYIASNTTVRFIIRDTLETGTDDGNYWQIDNVNITFSYTTPPTVQSSVFYAVGSVDSDNTESTSGNDRNDTYDWGITLVPEKIMSQSLIVGWAPGDDPTFIGTATENTAPIWLTGGHPIGSTQASGTYDICVDYNGDGGPTQDGVTGKYYNRKVTGIAPRTQLKIYKNVVAPPDSPPGTAGDDQTGTQIWVCGPTSPGPGDLATDAIITAAWGEDPLDAQPGKPGLDMGYTIRNSRAWRATKGVALQVDLNGNGLYDEGDTIRYTITVANTSATTIGSLTVSDTLPTNALYVTGSTQLTNHLGAVTTITDLNISPYTYTNLPAFKSFLISFDMTINPGASDPPGTVHNVAHITDGTTTLNPDVTIPVQAPRLGAIGNYVWLDEDGDGDQDAGEAGIPNMQVNLCSDAACTTILATTFTDANGGYLFPDLSIGTYYVRTYPTANLNQTYDENGVGTANVTMVSLGAGEEHLTADFGYNWSTTGETNTPSSGSTGAIGDRIWVDLDGDGKQDADEIGIQGVQVQLTGAGTDGIFGTVDDPAPLNATTDANGNYFFDGLTAGAFKVTVLTPPTGYTQTGDPDHFGTTGTNDNTTTTPIVLGPGDVFINADFGYQPTTAQLGSIGDYVWFDADGGADQDASEYGINGVTVSLIKDLGTIGVYEPGIDPIIATTITGDNPATPGVIETGWYQFSGLPANGTEDYLVWVNDTNNVLGDLVATYDASAPANGLSSVTNLTTTAVTNQDFGYTAPDNTPGITGAGQIGDYVWLDADGDGVQDAGEDGIEGVVVRLLDNTGALIAVTVTDENGHYYFADLAVSAGGVTYQVQVATASLPSGLTQTYDFDGTGTANLSTVALTTANPIRLDQDFGYRGLNTIGGTIWTDTNADGALSGESGWFQGVTVVLKDANGDIVATTTTNASGNYSFTNLPDGAFTVDVTDDANVLNGYWKSTGSAAGSDNNSQVDPYTVSVSGGQTNTTGDFGYYQLPAALGNFVWEDLDADGVQDAGEPGIAGVPVTATIAYPGGGTTTLTTVTDATGYYSFGNLLQDEDYNLADINAGTPTVTIAVAPPLGFSPTVENLPGTNDQADGDSDGLSEIATVWQGETDLAYDFGFVRLGAVGNYVWLDEDGDGDQDAGEAGIPNAMVQLCADAACTTVLATTYTDANGGYLFSDVPRGTYYVKVTPPAGLNATYDENGGLDSVSQVVLTKSGQEYMTADFGFNWSTPNETNNPGLSTDNTGAIGDRVWVDVDGDGKQDPDEVGLQGIPVSLYNLGPDGIYGTGDDVWVGLTTTDANGNYIFDNLPAGAYMVFANSGSTPGGYTQTGDPDQFGQTCVTCDNVTTTPIVLGPGDVFVNADFGYQPTTAQVGSIGDTVWFDANANSAQDGSETGIPGVTVALIKDLGTIGVYEPGIDLIIATDVTDAAGQYLFNGLPATGTEDYLVWVNDTNNVLGDLVPTYDATAPANGLSSVQNLTTIPVTNQDFGYAPVGQTTGEGLIGDTIFADRDLGNDYDPGEGLEGVVVRLYSDTNGDGNYDTGEPLLSATVTDENGKYSFGNLPPGNYVVAVDTTTLPGTLTNSVDPGGIGPLNESGVTLAAGEINLNQDFGYTGQSGLPGTIGNLIWNDVNANGVVDSGETGFGGVTVDLYWDANANGVLDAADKLIGTTTTSPAGGYYFNELAINDGGDDINYLVDVTDTANVLNGYWHSSGTTGVDNNSQADPYLVNMNGATRNNYTADFGYYSQPAAVGNYLWADDNSNGVQDAGENPIADWPVTLTIAWPNGQTTTVQTTTDATGLYYFGNLLQDEDYDGAGSGEPTFTISTPIPTNFVATTANAGGNDTLDSDGVASGADSVVTVAASPNTLSVLVKGTTNPDYDFGFAPTPTNVDVLPPLASQVEDAILVNWQTLDEDLVVGFKLYRATDANALPVDWLLVSQQGAVHPVFGGADYEYLDLDVQKGVAYTYWLEVQQKDGTTRLLGPTAAQVNHRTFLPNITRR